MIDVLIGNLLILSIHKFFKRTGTESAKRPKHIQKQVEVILFIPVTNRPELKPFVKFRFYLDVGCTYYLNADHSCIALTLPKNGINTLLELLSNGG